MPKTKTSGLTIMVTPEERARIMRLKARFVLMGHPEMSYKMAFMKLVDEALAEMDVARVQKRREY